MLATLCLTIASVLPVIGADVTPPVQADLHLDTPHQLHTKGLSLDAAEGLEAGLSQLQAGGTNVAVMVLWPPRKADHWPHVQAVLGRLERELDGQDSLALVRDAAAARRVAEAGGVGVVLALEGAHGLGAEGDWRARLDDLDARGLSMLGLTWSMSNRFAGSSGDGGGGLTDEGRELVAEARRRGLVLDLSHASRQTTLEVCRDSPVPVVASHSNAHAVVAHGRNLTDEEIRCIADSGGVIGLNFHATFVGAQADVGSLADHADHLAAVGGKGVVALGSDYDGLIRKPAGLPDASAIPALWAELHRRGWTEAEVAGVRGENFLRAWTAARPPATSTGEAAAPSESR